MMKYLGVALSVLMVATMLISCDDPNPKQQELEQSKQEIDNR